VEGSHPRAVQDDRAIPRNLLDLAQQSLGTADAKVMTAAGEGAENAYIFPS
jgi:hypothetical protein